MVSSNFFTDLHGLRVKLIKNHETLSNNRYELEKLYDYFKFTQPNPGLKCIIYLEQIRLLFRNYLQSFTPEKCEELSVCSLLQLLKNYNETKAKHKGILWKFTKKERETIEMKLSFVISELPDWFLIKTNEKFQIEREIPLKINQTNIVFYIPMTEIDPILNEEEQEIKFQPIITYQINKRFQFFKSKLNEFNWETFKEIVKNGLESSKTNEELFNYFLDIFGCEIFEFLTEILENRHSILEWGSNDVINKSAINYSNSNKNSENRNRLKPSIASQVIVQSEEEKNFAKTMRKIEKKQKKGQETGIVLNELEDDLNYLKQQPILRKTQEPQQMDFPHVHDQLRNISITTKFNGITFKQPENTIKSEHKTHVEFTIPGTTLSHQPQDGIENLKLINTNDLDAIGKMVFKDIEKFNRIQSEVYPIAYNTNENMLICAPTGAGKTNIALMAILHQIKVHMINNLIHKDDFKIVYVCPMKALATEMVANFTKKLTPIGITVKEITGDIQLSKKEINETQILVTTPEKWDVITRKGAVDTELTNLVKLLILDEVHLLNSDRGPVIEALVARTLRQVLSSQRIIRIVALSATLPGYCDVANFLKVNPLRGLFFFDNRYRSVPLTMTFIGMKTKEQDQLDLICYQKLMSIVKCQNNQVMVFVTSRNMTSQVAKNLLSLVKTDNMLTYFQSTTNNNKCLIKTNFKTADLDMLIPYGFGIHHAGMCRHDRLEIERLFRIGYLKVIVCTTTLAWGVNLPAHAVIIRGTTRYDAQKSSFVDMDMLDIQQIFGRAGRPQYDTSGHGIIITSVQNMTNYMTMLTSQTPIESQFLNFVPDNLNAEIVLGTVSNLKEAMEWLSNTFVYERIKKNPLVYGLTFTDVWDGEKLFQYLERQLFDAAKILEMSQMTRFDNVLSELRPTNYGRIASFFYISYKTMELFHQSFHREMIEADLLLLISRCYEFSHIQVRNDELMELERLHTEYSEIDFKLDTTSVVFKVLTLIQANIARAKIRVSSLVSDCEFIMQSVQRLARALFEIAVDKNYNVQVSRCLLVAQMVEQQFWFDRHPLLQFKELEIKSQQTIELLEIYEMNDLKEMSENDLNQLLKYSNKHLTNRLLHYIKAFPLIEFECCIKPITDGVIRIKLLLKPNFIWDNNLHGNVQHYYVWVEDPTHDAIYHFESIVLTKKFVLTNDIMELVFTVPLTKPHSMEYFVTVVHSKYIGAKTQHSIDLNKLNLLPSNTIETKFLNVRPLPKQALHNEKYMNLYKFTHFNAVQSQVFHCCYNSDTNILLGAPTGSGKTIVAELCMLRLFNNNPQLKVVYIAPMKALVRERVNDWSEKFTKIGKSVVEVTGDIQPQSSQISSAHIIITTPEKWDGMSRNWLQKDFVRNVGLVIIDEIHLLAEERGPVLEVIVSRMNYINTYRQRSIRIIGLSTAMANAGDLANWLNIENGKGLFNFSSSVRPVPLEIHLQGFSGKHYCPRMATMNRPAYQAICQYAPKSPTLIFVSSRKQTRITSYDLIKYLLNDTNPKQWLHLKQIDIELIRSQINDCDLNYLLMFGIGIHHAGLQENDRKIVESLFVEQKIQVLVATATLAWGVNFPAHLVIIKGTEYYDGLTKRYIDMPVTDILQMMGRAGRPQYDTSGVACVFVQENKKNFYRKFLFEPFPVESNLLQQLPEHVNAEIANGTITCQPQLLDFICSTFFFRRLLVNPTYYNVTEEYSNSNEYLQFLCRSVCMKLCDLNCITIEDNEQMTYNATFLGKLAAQYYLSCKTIMFLDQTINEYSSFDDLLLAICQVEEYALFPVRHNEDKINRHLCTEMNISTKFPYDSPHLKVFLLIKCYLFDCKLPNQEYVVDLKSVFDQIIRIIQAMISLTSYKSWLDCTVKLIYLNQMLIQGLLLNESPLLMLPYFNNDLIEKHLNNKDNLFVMYRNDKDRLVKYLGNFVSSNQLDEICKILQRIPILFVNFKIFNMKNEQVAYSINEYGLTTIETIVNDNCYFEFNLKRFGPNNLNIFSKKFYKQKEESWFFLLAFDNNLLHLQRFSIKKNKTLDCQIEIPQERGCYDLIAYVLCDSYLGLDQKVVFKIYVR